MAEGGVGVDMRPVVGGGGGVDGRRLPQMRGGLRRRGGSGMSGVVTDEGRGLGVEGGGDAGEIGEAGAGAKLEEALGVEWGSKGNDGRGVGWGEPKSVVGGVVEKGGGSESGSVESAMQKLRRQEVVGR